MQKVIFMHIQKTAGTAIVEPLRGFYGIENSVSHGDHFYQLDEKALVIKFFNNPELVKKYHDLPFISGHFGFDFCRQFMDARYAFTFLRDPAERILSYYFFCKARGSDEFYEYSIARNVSLDTFLEMGLEDPSIKVRLWNNQVWALAHGNFARTVKKIEDFSESKLLKMAKNNLKKFSYVGMVEDFGQDRNKIFSDLQIPVPVNDTLVNATPSRPKKDDLPSSTQKLLVRLTELDCDLYETFKAERKPYMKFFSLPFFNKKAHFAEALQNTRKEYLDLMIKTISGSVFKDPSTIRGQVRDYDPEVREHGYDWPLHAYSMIGRKRLENVRLLAESVLGNNIPGDLIETGVWRGGACILMNAVLHIYGVTDRNVWVADSFEGLPAPDVEKYPADMGLDYHTYPELSVSLAEVRQNFEAYGLLNKNVRFLKGWFKDTLPCAPIEKLALVRLDGDMYESTMDALVNLYPKLSKGGYVIVDDYHVVPACKKAVHDFCDTAQISPILEEIDGVGVFWKK